MTSAALGGPIGLLGAGYIGSPSTEQVSSSAVRRLHRVARDR
ncbi:MAG TPA: hypothetical protein VMF35_03790 [Acidimicrobiales bacterium]|nr:hypothetical protein [Acidimicrobiales bacterium]